MIKSFSYFVLLLVLTGLVSLARATELTDLGEGLSYWRIPAIDESAKGLTAAIRERKFLVLDLRHANTTADSAELLRTALNARTVKPPVFILVGPATPTAIGETLMSAAGKCLTFGIKESAPMPQVIIDQPAATDRLAYEALDSGQPLASLISGKIGKDRFDEAALMKEFNSGNINAVPPAAPDPTAKPLDVKPTVPAGPVVPEPLSRPAVSLSNPSKGSHVEPSKVEPLTDRVLQRAVHLHRALAAIKPR